MRGMHRDKKNHKGVHPFAQLGCEVVKDEVGKDLRHCADTGNVMAHHHVGEREICCGAVRQVRHDQSICRHTHKKGMVWMNKTKAMPC